MKSTELKTAAAYIRVSTDDQTELSPSSQIKVVQQYAKQNGYIIPKEYIFRDDGISGRRADKRPEFVKMVAMSKQSPAPFSAILLWKFSRFARNQEESIFYKAQLRKRGIDVLSVSEPIIDGPFGTLIERIIEWSDEYYSIRLSGEVKRGMTEKVERGGAVSVAPFGYKMEEKKLIINPETAPIVRKIFADYLNGVPIKQIAMNLNDLRIKTTRGNAWENRTVEYILRNPVYTGKIRWNPKRRTRRNYNDKDIMIVDGIHEPIIEQDIFDRTQARIEEVKKQYKPYTHYSIKREYMLHGLVKCSDCGLSLGAVRRGESLQCIGYTHGKCNVSHNISTNKLNEMVIFAIEQSFATGYFNLETKKEQTDEPEIDISALISKEQLKLKRIREAFEDGVYTLEEFKESKSLIEGQISRLREKEVESKPEDKEEQRKQFIDKHRNVVVDLKNPNISEEDKNALLKEFIEKIVFDRANTSLEIFFYT